MGHGCCGGGGHGHEEMAEKSAPSSCGSGSVSVQTGTKTSLTVTSTAAAKLKSIMQAEKKDPATWGLRMGVQGGGCSGMSYFMDFDTQQEGDRIVEQDGVRVFVDERSLQHLGGSVLDFTDGLMGSGFAIKNPNVKSNCGCGHSFTT